MLFVIAALLMMPRSSAAQEKREYCAFEVVVKSPAGLPVTPIGVAGLTEDGKVFSRVETNEQGIARLCDVPAGLLHIEVGGRLCGAVTVGYLKPLWMQTRRVFVTSQSCAGEDFWLPGGCMLTLRVHDAAGSPLSGAVFESPSERDGPPEQTRLSDSFGRIFRFLLTGETLTGRLLKNGYMPRSFREECKPGESFEKERVVVLGKGDQ